MKKSQLKNIIRESIKELMTEQATGNCTNPVHSNPAVNVPFGISRQAVSYTPGGFYPNNLYWFICPQQDIGNRYQTVPGTACCWPAGMPTQNVMNPVPNTSPNNDPYTAVMNAQSMSPGSNSGVNGVYARFEDCVMNCPGQYSPSNPPPSSSPCGDACWENYHNFGLTTTPQSPGPTGVGTDNMTSKTPPTQGSNNPCAEFSRFTRAEKSDICEECLTRPQGQFCECCEDTIIR